MGSMTSEHDDELQLLSEAIDGNHAAMQQLLLAQSAEVARFIESRLPRKIRSTVDTDDILQQTFIDAIRSVKRFKPQQDGTFLGWLKLIAERRLQDSVKAAQRAKRGGDFNRVQRPKITQSHSIDDIVNLLSAGSHSPSKSVARHEAVHAVQVAIQRLPDDYRRAVELRLLEGRSLDETAAAMNRTPRAVQGLVDRAKRKMRAALARLSI